MAELAPVGPAATGPAAAGFAVGLVEEVAVAERNILASDAAAFRPEAAVALGIRKEDTRSAACTRIRWEEREGMALPRLHSDRRRGGHLALREPGDFGRDHGIRWHAGEQPLGIPG